MRSITWNKVCTKPTKYEGWFKRNLRCEFISFIRIVSMLEEIAIEQDMFSSHHNIEFHFPMRVAVTIYYLGSSG